MMCHPACYGKLPALGDYLQHKAAAAEVGVWWNRFAELSGVIKPDPDMPLPWIFVLAPDVFSWSAGVHVVGVLVASHDHIGRRYPFIVWQKVTAHGMRCLFGSIEKPAPDRNWLFWLSRLVMAHVRLHSALSLSAAERGSSHFPSDLDRLWLLFKPSWKARFTKQHPDVDEEACARIIGPVPHPSEIEGVRYLPWTDWPERLWAPRALCYFWQQDHAGGYVRIVKDHHPSRNVLTALLCGEGKATSGAYSLQGH